MSCESTSNKLGRLVCHLYSGIPHLASKGSFYSGVAVGAAGTGVSMLVIAKLRRSKQRETQPTLIKVGPEGKSIEQTTTGRGRPITGKSTRLGSRDNPRKLTMGEANAFGTQNNPRKLNMQGVSVSGTRSNPRKLNMERASDQTKHDNVQPLPVLSAKPLETKLEMTSIQVLTSSGQLFASKNSYQVVHPDGTSTGLCVTPYIYEDEQGQPVEDMSAWCVSHTGTGALISGPYSDVSKAHHLATQLSTLRWTSANIPEADVEKAKQIIGEYQESLAEK